MEAREITQGNHDSLDYKIPSSMFIAAMIVSGSRLGRTRRQKEQSSIEIHSRDLVVLKVMAVCLSSFLRLHFRNIGGNNCRYACRMIFSAVIVAVVEDVAVCVAFVFAFVVMFAECLWLLLC